MLRKSVKSQPTFCGFGRLSFRNSSPKKSGTGQRLYRKRDVEWALRIKRLLYDDGYTIPGARQVFQADAREVRKKAAGPELPMPTAASNAAVAGLESVRKELRALAGILSAPVKTAPRPRIEQTGTDKKAGDLFEL